MKKHFPNMLTSCNLISGCIATLFAFQQNYTMALTMIIIGAVFDFFDGFAARLLRVSSPIGKELDSLADDITFGFAPSAIVFAMLRELIESGTNAACPLTEMGLMDYVPYLAFIIAAFSALRLAKFNLDERQTNSFIGLPTPANALFWGALAVALSEGGMLDGSTKWLPAALLLGVALSGWILVAEIPMFALKFKHFGLKGNELRYGFIALGAILLLLAGWVGFSGIIILYVITSIVNNAVGTKIVNEQ